MNYNFSLKTVGLVVGLLWVVLHAVALTNGPAFKRWLTAFPRAYLLGAILLGIDLVWTEVLAWQMDWGEFYYLQKWILAVLPVCFFLTVRFVDDYLAVRALGILALLAGAPVLDAAFLQPPASRLLVVVLAYVWIVLGMFWVGQPHLLRDQISWIQRGALRWQVAAMGGLVYGVLVLFCALVWY